jgi:hypothetical protein
MVKYSEIDNVNWEEFGSGFAYIPNTIYKILDAENEIDANKWINILAEEIGRESNVTTITILLSTIFIKLLKLVPFHQAKRIVKVLRYVDFSRPNESQLHKQLYNIMSTEFELFVSFLFDGDKEIRRAVSTIFARSVLHANTVSLWLCEQLMKEKDKELRIDLWGNLGVLLVKGYASLTNETGLSILSQIYPVLKTENLIEKGEAALICLIIQKEKIAPLASQILTDVIADMSIIQVKDWRLRNHFFATLLSLDEPYKQKLLLEILKLTSSSQFAASIVRHLLSEYELVHRKHEDLGKRISYFTAAQRKVIEAILESKAFWENDNINDILHFAKLENTKSALSSQLENSSENSQK